MGSALLWSWYMDIGNVTYWSNSIFYWSNRIVLLVE